MNDSNLIDSIHEATKSVIGSSGKAVPLHEPSFVGREWEYVKECLDTGWVSSVGKFVDRFEENLRDYTGTRSAVAAVNGTAALHLALRIAGVEPGDEVLTPALSFIATANAITYASAVPHFVDSETISLGVDADKLNSYLREVGEQSGSVLFNRRTGRPIRALVVMHTFGHPSDLDALAEVCQRYRLILVEDAAESIGSFYKGAHTGNKGLVSALSFNGNKILTTGGGGAIVTNDERLGQLAKHLSTTAKVSHKWEYEHDEVGYNYRMPNINAALGCAQLEQLPSFLSRKRALASRYQEAFQNMPGVRFLAEPQYGKSNYWLNAILLERPDQALRDLLLERLNSNGVGSRPVWKLMHRLRMFAECPRMDLSTAERLEHQVINLPSGAGLGSENEST